MAEASISHWSPTARDQCHPPLVTRPFRADTMKFEIPF